MTKYKEGSVDKRITSEAFWWGFWWGFVVVAVIVGVCVEVLIRIN